MPSAKLDFKREIRIPKDLFVLSIVFTLAVLLQAMAALDSGYLLLPLFCACLFAMCFVSPPAVGSFFLFGWVLLPAMDDLPFGPLQRVPATSLVALAVLLGLAAARIRNGSWRKLCRYPVLFYIALFLIIFADGYAGIVFHDKWGNLLVRTLAWQKFISCASMFVFGLLCCRDPEDFSHITRLIPIWFLLYLIYTPISAYLTFIQHLVGVASSYNVGLEYGTLNANTFGQGACVAAVAGYILSSWTRRPIIIRGFYFGLFLLATTVVLVTASRQSAIALVFGLWVAIAHRRLLVGFVLAAVVLAFLGGVRNRVLATPTEDVLLGRFEDLSKPGEEWSTQSAVQRTREINAALVHLWDHPLVGFGFGGYALTQALPDIASKTEVNETTVLNALSDEGYFLVGEHNFPIALYMETGLVGSISFFALLIGSYVIFRRRLATLIIIDKIEPVLMDRCVVSIGASIFVLQNISGGLSMGSMSTLLFLVGAMLAGFGWRPRINTQVQSE